MEGGETHVRMLRLATNSVGLRLCLPTDQTYDELTTGALPPNVRPVTGAMPPREFACADVALPGPFGPVGLLWDCRAAL